MSKSQKGHAHLIAIAIVLVVIIVAAVYAHSHHKTVKPITSSTNTSAAKSSGKLSGGSDDQSLNSNLQQINRGLNEGDQDLQNSNKALSDQQSTVIE